MGLNSHCSLNKFFIVNCAFPVTSNTYSTKEIRSRQNGKFGLQRIHWMSRSADESIKFCHMCTQPLSAAACYKIACAEHQTSEEIGVKVKHFC